MSVLLEDPDVLVPDNPDELQPDHDESLATWLVPEEQRIVKGDVGLPPLSSFLTEVKSTGGGPNVKFPREIHEGMHGEDVIGHKRAISRARPDLYPWPKGGGFTDLAGPFFMDAVVKWKKSKGIGTSRVLGGRAHEVLEDTRRHDNRAEYAFDARAIALCQEYYDRVTVSPEQRVRNAGVQAGFYWYGHKFNISYSQFRPMELGKPPFVPHRWDCSGFATNCHYAGGANDPNRRGYDHLGYTGTLMIGGNRVMSVTNLEPLDLIFYGHSVAKPGFNAGDPTHVAVYVGFRDGAHMVLSLGSYPMSYVPYNYRHDVNHFRHYNVV